VFNVIVRAGNIARKQVVDDAGVESIGNKGTGCLVEHGRP